MADQAFKADTRTPGQRAFEAYRARIFVNKPEPWEYYSPRYRAHWEAAAAAVAGELVGALAVARKSIQAERDSVFDCHTLPGEAECSDALGCQALAELDKTLAVIDAALGA